MTNPTAATLRYADYKDKVLAGWMGKSMGGVIGARLEGHKELKDLAIGELFPSAMMPNDDLDIQVVWLEAMQERGLYLTSLDLADYWRDRCWYSFCEYGVFLNNVQRGIAPPLSGIWNNRFFLNSEGCPIRADIWGFVAPGNPGLAAELARLDGQLDHGEISIQLEQFLAAAAARALLTTDLEVALAAGLSVIPEESRIAEAVHRVREIAAQYPDTRQAWRVVIREYGNRNVNDSITNHALVLLALFAGQGDFKRTMQLCANFGWDTDCTASTAGALLGTLCGTAGLPPDWIERLGTTLITAIDVKHVNCPLVDFADDTCRIGVEMAAVRNPDIRITGAPEVAIRPAPAPAVTIDIDYMHTAGGAGSSTQPVAYPKECSFDPGSLGQPVLWKSKTSELTVRIANHTDQARRGRLEIDIPEGVLLDSYSALEIAPNTERTAVLQVRRDPTAASLRDKNLFRASWSEGETEIAARTFGLGGARQWQVYGPYWDMWDRTKNSICPYSNDKFVGGPFMVGLTGDCYNSYADLNRAYLDEGRLVRDELPEETPLLLEQGEDMLAENDFGGYTGQACYYLTRTVRSTVPDLESHIVMGRTGPYRIWFDGAELGSATDPRGWAMLDNANHKVKLTGQPQRLVIKLIRLTDAFNFSLIFMGRGSLDGKQGISNILDCLEDVIEG